MIAVHWGSYEYSASPITCLVINGGYIATSVATEARSVNIIYKWGHASYITNTTISHRQILSMATSFNIWENIVEDSNVHLSCTFTLYIYMAIAS